MIPNSRLPLWPLLALTPVMLLAVTALDGRVLAVRTSLGQPAAVALTLAFWALFFWRAPQRLRVLMGVGLFAATAGEVFFSLGLGMYRYRLDVIPAYVPPGHTLLLATVYLFVRRPWVRRHRTALTALLLILGAAYSVAWLERFGDRYGFGCYLAFLIAVLAMKRSRLFLSSMYLLVAWLELLGTHFGAWSWPARLLGRFEAIPSGNPPSGVALFYLLFDLSCLLLYLGARFTSFERLVSRRIWRKRAGLA